jgi:DNA-binding response OmpR family regulator
MKLAGIVRGGSVLFVDDERPIRALFRRAFASLGIDFDDAADGNQALAKLEQRRFDAVVIDVIMPDRDGVETIQLIRERWPQTYIIAMSGGGRIGPDEFLKLAAEVGADRTLTKPFRPAHLVSLLADGPPSKLTG